MQGKAENLEACGHAVVPTLPLPLSNLANTGIKIPAVLLEHFRLSFPEKSRWVLPLIETSSLWKKKSSSGAQKSRKSWGILSLASAFRYHLGVLLRLQKRLELWPWGHSRGRLPSSSLKPIQLKWQEQVAAIFKPVWGTPCDSTGNVQLKFLKKGGGLWGGAATEQANDCVYWKVGRFLEFIFEKKMLPIYFALVIRKHLECWQHRRYRVLVTGLFGCLFAFTIWVKESLVWLNDWLTGWLISDFWKQGSYRSDSLCSWGYPWILYLPPSTFQNLGLQGNATMAYPEKLILLTYLLIIYLWTVCMSACSHVWCLNRPTHMNTSSRFMLGIFIYLHMICRSKVLHWTFELLIVSSAILASPGSQLLQDLQSPQQGCWK